MIEDYFKEYINNCNDDDKMTQGLLRDLCEDVPEDLHVKIMNSINKKRNSRHRFMCCIRRFSAVAALIAIVVLSSKLFISVPNGKTAKKASCSFKGSGSTAMKETMNGSSVNSDKYYGTKSADSSFNINYEIFAADNPDVLNFIKNNCKADYNNVYILKTDVFENVVKMLDKNSVKLIKEPKNSECDVIIKITK